MLLFIFIIYIYEMMLCRSINSKFSAMFTPLLENICRNIFYSFFSCSSICPILAFLPKAIAVWPSYQHPNMATHKNFPDSAAKKEAAYRCFFFPYYYLLCFNCLRGLPALFHLQAFPALFRLRGACSPSPVPVPVLGVGSALGDVALGVGAMLGAVLGATLGLTAGTAAVPTTFSP